MQLINIGTIVNAKGLKGVLNLANSPNNIIVRSGTTVFVGYSENFAEEYTLAADFAGSLKNSAMSLGGIDTRDKAVELKEKGVFVDKEELLKQNHQWTSPDDIVGCMVYDIKDNTDIGEIIEVWELPANNVWLVATNKGELPIPVIDDVIKNIDLERKVVGIEMLDGLWDIVINEVK